MWGLQKNRNRNEKQAEGETLRQFKSTNPETGQNERVFKLSGCRKFTVLKPLAQETIVRI